MPNNITDAVLINHRTKVMFYLKDGDWESLDIEKLNSTRYLTEILYKICKNLSDISREDLQPYIIWLAAEFVHFAKNTKSTDLELIDGSSSSFMKLAKNGYIFAYNRDMNKDARDEILLRYKKNIKKNKK